MELKRERVSLAREQCGTYEQCGVRELCGVKHSLVTLGDLCNYVGKMNFMFSKEIESQVMIELRNLIWITH